MIDKSGWLRLGLGVGVLATAVLLWFLPDFTVRQSLTFALLALWPMLTWSLLFEGGWDTRLLTAGGLVLLLQTIVALLIYYLPGSLPRGLLIFGLTIIPLLPLGWQPKPLPPLPRLVDRRLWPLVAGLLLIILILRWPNLGYKEFQGDEGIIMTRAAAMLTGDDAELFNHQKGPIEILFPLILWGSGGAITEFWARLPFWWGSLLLIGVIIWLATGWFSLPVGLLAGLLFGINGFGVAFSRIVQYQTFVMLWGTLAVIFADLYGKNGRKQDLWLTAVFLAGGLLAHYDAILFLPVIVWLVWPQFWPLSRLDWRSWGVGLALGTGLLSLFYLPFFLNPNFGRTGSYLLSDRLGGSLLSWSGPEVWQMITFYNSIYTILGLLLLIFATIWARNGRKQSHIAAWLYFLIPLGFYLLIVADPRTHVYTFFPGAAVLAAVGLMTLHKRLMKSSVTAQRIGQGILLLFLFASVLYPYLLFVDTRVERQRNWAETGSVGYPTTIVQPPLYGLFGFPYQAGWRAVATLPLALPIASNEEEEITNIYLGPAARTFCPDANTFILANNVQDVIPYDPAMLADWYLQYEVTVNGRSTMQIYAKEPVETVQTVEAGDATLWLRATAVAPPSPQPDFPLDIVLGDNQVRLLGYNLDSSQAYPGGQIKVTLFWQALAPFQANYQIFTHLWADDLVAQDDNAPECGFNPTIRWEPDTIVPDTHILSLAEFVPEGQYSLLTGMYQLQNLERLSVPNSPDNTILLTKINISQSGNE